MGRSQIFAFLCRGGGRQTIGAQLAAFAADDAQQAFSYASPTIQETFITARNFMDMERIAYPVVYRPGSLSFQVPYLQGNEVWQTVEMRDSEGVPWTAIYTLLRQPDGLWRISGCVLRRGLGRAVLVCWVWWGAKAQGAKGHATKGHVADPDRSEGRRVGEKG